MKSRNILNNIIPEMFFSSITFLEIGFEKIKAELPEVKIFKNSRGKEMIQIKAINVLICKIKSSLFKSIEAKLSTNEFSNIIISLKMRANAEANNIPKNGIISR